MRSFFVAVTVVLYATTSGLTFAATPTAEPSLPADIVLWAKSPSKYVCEKHVGKSIVSQLYTLDSPDSIKWIRVLTLNGKKVSQAEYSRKRDAEKKDFSWVYYVRSSPKKSWLVTHEWNEVNQQDGRVIAELVAELHPTVEQLRSCGWD